MRAKRWHECSWLEKAWRSRWLLTVPFYWTRMMVAWLLHRGWETEWTPVFMWRIEWRRVGIDKLRRYVTLNELRATVLGDEARRG